MMRGIPDWLIVLVVVLILAFLFVMSVAPTLWVMFWVVEHILSPWGHYWGIR